jgi:hypothetical protein
VTIENGQLGQLLRRAAKDFEYNGLSRGAIRQCERQAPEAFLLEGLRTVMDADDSAGYRFLAILLVGIPSVFQMLCDRRQFTQEDAIKIAKRLQKVDQNFDTRMCGLLPDRNNARRPFSLEGGLAERALEILDAISPGRRIVPIMRHLTGYSDPRIASKASLLIGKRLQNLSWARRVLAESNDPRVRANALEAFWGMDAPDVIDLFRRCVDDPDNRVVGNAIIGLHEAGEPEAFHLAIEIASKKKPSFRMTAAWIMGKIANVDFFLFLTRLARDEEMSVRRSAINALRVVNRSVPAQVEEPKFAAAPEPEVEVIELETIPAEPPRVAPQRLFWS